MRRVVVSVTMVVSVRVTVTVVSVRVTMTVVSVVVADVAMAVMRVRDAERVKTRVLVDVRCGGVPYFGALGDGFRRGRGRFASLDGSGPSTRRRVLHGSTGARRRTVAIAAPKPLSMFTTVTPEAQLVSMPKSAVMPANATP